jgi:hypothetical protein
LTTPAKNCGDRVVRGRAWIAVLGVMLAGIVAMQIEVLKLGASIGRSLQRGSSLQSRNEQLRASVAELGDDQRIETLAGTMGMVMPAPDGVGFVSVGPGLVQKAIANIHQPNTPAFLALTDPNGAVTGASTASSSPTASGLSTASGTSTAGTTGATGTTGAIGTVGVTGATPAGAPAAGTTSSTGISGQTTQTGAGATSAPITTTQPATPASSVPQSTSPASATTGAAGTAALTPTQPSSPTGGTGGAGVPAAG